MSEKPIINNNPETGEENKPSNFQVKEGEIINGEPVAFFVNLENPELNRAVETLGGPDSFILHVGGERGVEETKRQAERLAEILNNPINQEKIMELFRLKTEKDLEIEAIVEEYRGLIG